MRLDNKIERSLENLNVYLTLKRSLAPSVKTRSSTRRQWQRKAARLFTKNMAFWL